MIGPFDNDTSNEAIDRDWIGETTVEPRNGMVSAGQTWNYFDDRLFSRNYDDFQDLYSLFCIKQCRPPAAYMAYAHVYIHSQEELPVDLRITACDACRVWLNGALKSVAQTTASQPDSPPLSLVMQKGWNRLLVKVACRKPGRFGFTARLMTCHPRGSSDDLTFSTDGDAGPLTICSQPQTEGAERALPDAYRGWPYFGCSSKETRSEYGRTILHQAP